MSELDKKTLPSKPTQVDLVGQVLDASERKNQERVDMLITNAIKQLKMSRFKPDQTACISLTYLARTSPQVFNQSNSIREMLKTLLRRDQGPANIKGKSDTILPVLAANILLATCDGPEVRNLILGKLDQWLTSSPKVADIVMHVLTIICEKCQSDQQTIAYLIEMRRHWISYVTNLQSHDVLIPSDLSDSVRRLLERETDPNQIILYINFLDRYDRDYDGLSQAIAKLISHRPMTLICMFEDPDHGLGLCRSLIGLFTKILYHLRFGKNKPQQKQLEQEVFKLRELKEITEASVQTIKNEVKETKMDLDAMAQASAKKPNSPRHEAEEKVKKFDIDKEVLRPYVPSVYVKPTSITSKRASPVWQMDKNTFEAVLLLLILIEGKDELRPDWVKLAQSCLVDCDDAMTTDSWSKQQMSGFYSDYGLTQTCDIPTELRKKLYLSQSEILVELSLRGASVGQLVRLLCQFDSNPKAIDKVLKLLGDVKDVDLIRSEINDGTFFYHLMEFYTELGSSGAKEFLVRLEQV